MSEPLEVAVVTGAARGIGLAVARQLASDGFRVYATDVLADDLKRECDALRAQGLDIKALALDVSNEQAVASLPQRLGEDYRQIRVLVNNAAISPKQGGRKISFSELTPETWNRVIAVNLTGAFLMSQVCLPPMLRAGFGRVVNNSSMGAKTVLGVAVAAYYASKAGLLGLTRSLALEVGAQGVTVNSVCPGRIETPLTSQAPQEVNDALIKRTPVGRIGTSDEVADLISFLVSRKAGFITGAAFDINGGMAMV